MNSKILVLFIFSFFARDGAAQSYSFLYHLDKDLSSTSKEQAVIIGKGYQSQGRFILDCFLKATGKKILSATVKDSSLSTLHGMFTTYYDDMSIESAGNYAENDMEGAWRYWDKNGYLTDSMIYQKGVRIAYGSYQYFFSRPETVRELVFGDSLKNATYSYIYSFTDSLNNTFYEKQVSYKKGIPKTDFEVTFNGKRGFLKEYDSTGTIKTDSVFSKDMREAQFDGGENGWRNFLRTNLDANVPALNNAPSGKYTIIIRFIVNRDGTLADIKAESDPGYGMVQEGIRVLKKSVKWIPAVQYGKYRPAYRRQPITFLVEN